MELLHYGIKRRSGRYPYGSGERPYQSDKSKGLEVNPKIIREKNSYRLKNNKGQTVSEAKYYDFKMKDFDWILLADIETRKDYRGKGLATTILNNMYANVIKKENPKKGFYLFVKDDNENAIDLYRKLGFDAIKKYNLDGGNKGDYLIMVKGNANRKQFDRIKFG